MDIAFAAVGLSVDELNHMPVQILDSRIVTLAIIISATRSAGRQTLGPDGSGIALADDVATVSVECHMARSDTHSARILS